MRMLSLRWSVHSFAARASAAPKQQAKTQPCQTAARQSALCGDLVHLGSVAMCRAACGLHACAFARGQPLQQHGSILTPRDAKGHVFFRRHIAHESVDAVDERVLRDHDGIAVLVHAVEQALRVMSENLIGVGQPSQIIKDGIALAIGRIDRAFGV